MFKLDENDKMREKRLKRFESENHSHSDQNNNHKSSSHYQYNNENTLYDRVSSEESNMNEPIVGRSTELEKRYLRLTSAPDLNNVRPLHILRQTLELLKTKWKDEQNYSYICDQFKSLRQDLTVQHIQNEFTVTVYEIHARIALEKGDLGEYNQCQSRLKTLYENGIPGNENEFLAYRILYMLHTRNRSDMNDIYFQLEDIRDKKTGKLDAAVQHALDVNTAISGFNYHKFFGLYVSAPNMGGYIMDMFINRERLAALGAICKAFRPEVDVNYIVQELGFVDTEEFLQFSKDSSWSKFIYSKGEENDGNTSTTDGESNSDDDENNNNNKKTSNHNNNGSKTSTLFLKTKEAFPLVEQLRISAFQKVDIKGQI